MSTRQISMKKIIYSSKIEKDLSIMYDSDLHYMPGMDLSYLSNKAESLRKNPTTYYFLLGDLVNDSRIDLRDLRQLRDVLAKIAKTKTNVYAILGNHDQVTKNENGIWENYYNKDYVNMLHDIDGFNILENEKIKDGNIVIHGTRFDGHHYEQELHEPIEECIDVMSKTLDYGSGETFNILLNHSPYRVFDKEILTKIPHLNKTDIIFSGHFHNGLIPSYISKYLPGNFGLIAYMKLFPPNARGNKRINDNTLGFISTPITTFGPHYGPLQKLNLLYPPIEQKILVKKI